MSDGDPSALVNISAIQTMLATIHEDGKNVVMSEEASLRIAEFKRAQKLMKEAEDVLKEQLKIALEPFHASTLRGRYATISIGKPRPPASKYKIDSKAPEGDDFKKEKIILVPDEDKINAYFDEHGELPEGITDTPLGEGSVSIRVKE